MKRVTIFAHYDKNGLIQDYVLYWLKELKKVSEKIIFVSDGEIDQKELDKISKIFDYSITERHEEYDFGSYKRGYFYAKQEKWLNNCDELIMCNDSCYGPLFDIEQFFSDMSSKTVDFWGNTANPLGLNNVYNPHCQSYFLVFKPQVFNSKTFDKFFKSVSKQEDRDSVIANYEINLTQTLSEKGYIWDVYCQSSKKRANSQLLHYQYMIINEKSPFVKTSIYRGSVAKYGINPSFEVIKNLTNYDINLINKDLKCNGETEDTYINAVNSQKPWRKSL